MERARPPIRLLVMDDQEDLVTLISITAEIDGRFEVVGTASDGAAAVELGRRVKPEVVILDHLVEGDEAEPAGMSGRQAIGALRSWLPDVFIVMYSGLSPADGDLEAVDLYLVKGEVDPVTMLNRVAASWPGGPG